MSLIVTNNREIALYGETRNSCDGSKLKHIHQLETNQTQPVTSIIQIEIKLFIRLETGGAPTIPPRARISPPYSILATWLVHYRFFR